MWPYSLDPKAQQVWCQVFENIIRARPDENRRGSFSGGPFSNATDNKLKPAKARQFGHESKRLRNGAALDFCLLAFFSEVPRK
jgi:hypothetical protein